MFGEGDLRGCGGFIRVSRGRGGSRGSSPVHGGGWEGGMLKNQRKDTYYSSLRGRR
jgi:hypothetical protein